MTRPGQVTHVLPSHTGQVRTASTWIDTTVGHSLVGHTLISDRAAYDGIGTTGLHSAYLALAFLSIVYLQLDRHVDVNYIRISKKVSESIYCPGLRHSVSDGSAQISPPRVPVTVRRIRSRPEAPVERPAAGPVNSDRRDSCQR